MNIGDQYTWFSTNKGNSCYLLITGLIVDKEVTKCDDDPVFKIRVLYYSGGPPERLTETWMVRRSELIKGRAQEWQHTTRVVPPHAAAERHKEAVRRIKRDFKKREKALHDALRVERRRFARLAQKMAAKDGQIMVTTEVGAMSSRTSDTAEPTVPHIADKVRSIGETRRVTKVEIESHRTHAGGFTAVQLAKWGVPWPPPKGWKNALQTGQPIPS